MLLLFDVVRDVFKKSSHLVSAAPVGFEYLLSDVLNRIESHVHFERGIAIPPERAPAFLLGQSCSWASPYDLLSVFLPSSIFFLVYLVDWLSFSLLGDSLYVL